MNQKKNKIYNMNQEKNHLVDLITDIENFIHLKRKDLNQESLYEFRDKCLNSSKIILDNFNTYRDQLDKLGFRYPYSLTNKDALYYLILHLLKLITNNYNNLIPINVTRKLQLIDSMTTKPRQNSNNLDLGLYLMDCRLERILLNASVHMDKLSKKNITKKSFYVVVFNKLWNSKLNRYTLVYNYTKYNKIFFDLYYSYAIIEQISRRDLGHTNTGAGHFFLLDNQLNYNDILKKFLFKHDIFIRNLNTIKGINIKKNFIDICKYTVKGHLLPVTLTDMCSVINNLVLINKNDNEYKSVIISKLHRLLYTYKGISPDDSCLSKAYNLMENCDKKIFNDLTRFVFIVSDIGALVNTIKKSNQHNNICQGPSSERGTQSLIGNILYEFDKDFRHSMYNHNKLYSNLLDINGNSLNLDWKVFSYKNIHCNLGYAKW